MQAYEITELTMHACMQLAVATGISNKAETLRVHFENHVTREGNMAISRGLPIYKNAACIDHLMNNIYSHAVVALSYNHTFYIAGLAIASYVIANEINECS